MSDSKVENNDLHKDFFDHQSEIDQELVSLGTPPPSLRYGLFTLAISLMTVVMLVWFSPELVYFFKMTSNPTDLGDATDIDVNKLHPNTYVSVDGLPQLTNSLTFNEGIKWFSMSDTRCNFFTLTGQPNLFVQWRMPEEHKAFRNPEINPVSPGPPSHFEGHLVKRDDMGPNFNRVWAFFDCRRSFSLRRCNTCLGVTSMDKCLNMFTCLERNTPERCKQIMESEEEARDPGLKLAIREQNVSLASVKLEQWAAKAKKLERAAAKLGGKDKASIKDFRVDILKLSLEELKIRAKEPFEKINSLEDSARKEVGLQLADLEELRLKETEQVENQRILTAFSNIGKTLNKLKKKVSGLKTKISALGSTTVERLVKWKCDPETTDGKGLLKSVDTLEVILLDLDDAAKRKAHDAGSGVDEKRDRETHKQKGPSKSSDNPQYETIITSLDKVNQRATALMDKIAMLAPGQKPLFDKWARKPDVLGQIPEELRTDNVVSAMGKLEQMVADLEPVGDDAQSLGKRLKNGIKQLNETRKKIKDIEAQDGIRYLKIVNMFEAFEKKVASGTAFEKAGVTEREFDQLKQAIIEEGFYMAELKGTPTNIEALEKKLAPKPLQEFERRFQKLAAPFEKDDWVLIDDEKPGDKIWIVLVYLVLLVMLIVNLIKLRRFWIMWRA